VALVIAFPAMVLSSLDRGSGIDPSKIQIAIPMFEQSAPPDFK
jgi:hypothetical protein